MPSQPVINAIATRTVDTADANAGLAAAVMAYLFWGLFPLYLKLLAAVPALQVTAHRFVWCCVLLLGWLGVRGELPKVKLALLDRSVRLRMSASAALISLNWLVYVIAVNSGHVVEASLG